MKKVIKASDNISGDKYHKVELALRNLVDVIDELDEFEYTEVTAYIGKDIYVDACDALQSLSTALEE